MESFYQHKNTSLKEDLGVCVFPPRQTTPYIDHGWALPECGWSAQGSTKPFTGAADQDGGLGGLEEMSTLQFCSSPPSSAVPTSPCSLEPYHQAGELQRRCTRTRPGQHYQLSRADRRRVHQLPLFTARHLTHNSFLHECCLMSP